jgi:hypothetical protein
MWWAMLRSRWRIDYAIGTDSSWASIRPGQRPCKKLIVKPAILHLQRIFANFVHCPLIVGFAYGLCELIPYDEAPDRAASGMDE